MATPTPNLGLIKPDMSDEVDQTIPDLATSLGKIDAATGKLSDLTTTDKTSLVAAISESSNGLVALKADNVQKFSEIDAEVLNLQSLKAEKSEVNTLASDKADISYVDTIASSLASGSPKGTYANLAALSAAIPSGNTNTYLTSDNGNWNYWNGSAWTAGGLYQSTGVANDSISLEKLTSNLKSDIYFPLTNLLTHGNFDVTTNWNASGATFSVLSNTGEVTGNGTSSSTRLYQLIGNVNVGDKIYIKTRVRVTNTNAQNIFITLTQSPTNNLLQIIRSIITPTIDNWYEIEKIFVVTTTELQARIQIYAFYADASTANGKVLEIQYIEAINLTNAMGAGHEFTVGKMSDILSNFQNSWFDGTINAMAYDDNIMDLKNVKASTQAIFNESSFDTTPLSVNVTYKNYINCSTGALVSNSNYNTVMADVSPNKKYYITSSVLGAVTALVVFYDVSDSYISFQTIGASVLAEYVDQEIITPANCYRIGATTNITGKNDLPIIKPVTTSKLIQDVKALKEIYTPLSGQVHLIIGDSISADYTLATKHYSDYLSDTYNTVQLNKAANATGWLSNYSNGVAGAGDSLKGRITSGYFDGLSFDFCTILYGTNDWGITDSLGTSGSAPLGSINDSVSTLSIYGGIKYCLSSLLNKYPTKGFGVVSPTPRSEGMSTANGKGVTLSQIITALKDCCEFYAIPFIDIIHSTRLKPWVTANRTAYYADGLHLNNSGHEYVYKQLKNWVTTL